MNETIYINGVQHRCEWTHDHVFFADTPELPGRRCSCHTFKDSSSRMHLDNGGAVLCSGNHYSKRAPVLPILVYTDPNEEDMWDAIAYWLAYAIGALMACAAFGIAAGYVYVKFFS